MNKKETKKGRHSQESLLGISLLYVVNRTKETLHLINNKKAEDPRLQPSGMMTLLNNGFTFIELLVVVLIIGILAAIALPQYEKAVEKARVAEALSLMSSLQNAMDVYILENGYPSSGQVKFLGNDASVILPIEIVTSVRNADTSYNNIAQTKYFRYNAYCGDGYCDVVADRTNPDGTKFYRLFYRKYSKTKTKICQKRNNLPIGVKMCALLQKDGWTPGDLPNDF